VVSEFVVMPRAVLETGNIVLSGPAATLLADERVRKAYLGEA